MYEFFILGQVPGTSLVINFVMWIELAALATTLGFWAYYRRQRAMHSYDMPIISNDQTTLTIVTAQ